ncbi:M23 family metallopeptidase [Sphingobium sp. CR28]|uniref:M23 family metallopeptidase n=1 Tax=Sphingobium sp. CR28 TaxID=3400272 RepID=UPI003FF09946
MTAFALVVGVALLWLGLTLSMVWSQASLVTERSALAKHSSQVARQQAQVNAYRNSVDKVARDIEARQDALDRLVAEHLGAAKDGELGADLKSQKAATGKAPGKISAATPAAQRLHIMASRQQAFEANLLASAQDRIRRIERAIRGLGVNPSQITQRTQAMGGPFIPARGQMAQEPSLRDLSATLARLSALQAGFAALPSGRPTQAPMETSSYGYRRDPFNGLAAFHAGIDFPGRYGQPIEAAADGRISFVGTRSGYGNVVEVEHGNGIMTRYAHLSRFVARPGDRVARGQTIARMGSTGRSTGTHLHFEVRINGAAVNPRPFLEARQDVLEVQQVAQRRHAIGGNGR